MTPVLELQNVSSVFGSQKVLWELSLAIHSGETVAIIGESGCGKSVTMKVLMQLLSQSAGHVKWFGNNVSELSPTDYRQEQLRLGYLFQGGALFDSLSVFENIAFGLRNAGERDNELIHKTVIDRLVDVGLSEDIAAKRPSEISGGMQKRVGLARALALNPEVMFYDEPTTGLDPVNSRRIDDLILSVRDTHGVTGVIVTHDFRTVQRVADRVLMLYPRRKLQDSDSQLIFDGPLTQLVASTDPRVREYIGDELQAVAA